MDKQSRVFVGEFITGGGLATSELQSLAHEGDMMLQSLLQDLLDAGYKQIICPRTTTLPQLRKRISIIDMAGDGVRCWQEAVSSADVAWIIAPEKNNILYDLVCMATASQCLWTGCTPEAVRLTTSKLATLSCLADHRVPVSSYYQNTDTLQENKTGWVIKPDDGVGGEGCYFFSSLTGLRDHIRANTPQNVIIQEFLPGIPASLSMLCSQGRSELLACNEQLFTFEEGKGRLQGVVVNGLRRHVAICRKLADQVVAAIPGLNGIIGVDFILTSSGPVVMEINPRLTSAYAGLRRSLGLNPAALVLDMLENGSLPDLTGVNYQPVTIRL